jgi:RIO-like serine/threonine protein kinase
MSSLLPAGKKIGRYEIRSQLGVGGMGEVYLAEDTKLDRKVALKILPSNVASGQERMVRFVREAKATNFKTDYIYCHAPVARREVAFSCARACYDRCGADEGHKQFFELI